jgi:hypothetical protein
MAALATQEICTTPQPAAAAVAAPPRQEAQVETGAQEALLGPGVVGEGLVRLLALLQVLAVKAD